MYLRYVVNESKKKKYFEFFLSDFCKPCIALLPKVKWERCCVGWCHCHCIPSVVVGSKATYYVMVWDDSTDPGDDDTDVQEMWHRTNSGTNTTSFSFRKQKFCTLLLLER